MTENAYELLDICDQTVAAGREAIDWFKANPESVKHEQVPLDRSFRRHVMAAGKLRVAVERPMCVGVFGASQAGKSYLISALARKETASLTTTLGGRRIDYLKEINPEGGKESTGLVTRFTIRDVPSLEDAPVSLRLLTESDVIKILGNSYLADVDQAEVEPPDGEELAVLLDTLEARASQAPVDRLTMDDVFDIQDYFDRFFGGSELVRALRVSYWERAAELAPTLTIDDRVSLFGVLWNNIRVFGDAYKRLYRVLSELGFATEACCGLEGLQPRTESIINVETLQSLGDPNASNRVTLKTLTGRSVTASRAEATALIAEISIKIDEKPWDFFDHTDLLDFPGARTREIIRDSHSYLEDGSKLWLLFVRGKVAYLYDRYCADQELTSMLLCVGPSNQEVATVPSMIKRWIDSTHGERPEDRGKQDTALFLVLTKFDMEFGSKKGSDDADSSTRWTTRLEASFLHFFGKQDEWPYHWDARNSPFTNIFWVRNPNVVDKALLDYTEDGLEQGIRASEISRIESLKEGYLSNPDVRTYIAGPEQKWDEAMRLNDGGIGLLVERLRPVCRPELKLRQIASRISLLRDRMGQRLRPFYISDDKEAEKLKRLQELDSTVLPCVFDCIDSNRYGVLLRSLMVEAKSMETVFKQVRFQATKPRQAEAEAPAPSAASTRARISGGFRDRIRSTRQDSQANSTNEPGATAPVAAPAKQQSEDAASTFADAVMRSWSTQMRELSQDEQQCGYFLFDQPALDRMVNEILIGAERHDIASKMTEDLREWTKMAIDAIHSAPGAGIIAANAINGYLGKLGFDQRPIEARPKAQDEDGKLRPIFSPPPASDTLRLPEEPRPFQHDYYVDWIEALRFLTEENAGGGTDANTEQNRALGAILAKLGEQVVDGGMPVDE